MGSYERAWSVVAGVVGAVALIAAVSSSTVLPIIGLFLCVGMLTVLFVLPWLTPSAVHAWTLVRTGAVAGSVSVVCFGLAHLVGAVTMPVVLLLAASAPVTAPLWARWARRLGWGGQGRGPSAAAAVTVEDVETDRPPPLVVGLAVVVPAVGEELQVPDRMSNEDLCQAWRSSFVALGRAGSADSVLRVVEMRALYLDELERRAGSSFRAWLHSGARAAGDPSRHLSWDLGGP